MDFRYVTYGRVEEGRAVMEGLLGAWHARLEQDGPAVRYVVERAGTYGAEGWGWVRGDWVVRWGWEGMTLE